MTYFIGFLAGIVCAKLWDYFYVLGTHTLMFKTGMDDCLIMLAKNIQSVYELNELKYMSLDMVEKDEKFIKFHKTLDEREMSSMKNTVIRNFINPIPSKYNHLVPFRDWEGAMEYINDVIQNKREER
tara:strand:- start:43 stop:423 length:381 start_codon:yes stop_codon:yes gene_type:complete